MFCALHTYYPCSLNLSIYAPFQLPWYFSENPAPSGIRNRTEGGDIAIVPRPSLFYHDYGFDKSRKGLL